MRLMRLIEKLVAEAESKHAKVFVEVEGESMQFRGFSIGDGGVYIRYGTSSKGQWGTQLTEVIHYCDGYLCARDWDGEGVILEVRSPRQKYSEGFGVAGDLTGETYGQLTVITMLGVKNGRQKALCECRCGQSVERSVSELTAGRTISCGCRRGKNTEIPLKEGSKYGNLTVLEKVPRPAGMKKNEGYYRMRCVCGNEIVRGREKIVRAQYPDCGCGGYAALVGRRFGRLVVIPGTKLDQKQRYVNTRCDCGCESYAALSSLRRGKKRSCGCLRIGPRRGRAEGKI